jgi:hypothetical protein
VAVLLQTNNTTATPQQHHSNTTLSRKRKRWYYFLRRRLQGINQSAKRLPITIELLLAIELERFRIHDVAINTQHGRMMRAATWLGTCGLLRAGEFAVRDKESALLDHTQAAHLP